jgi:hypothetical protein
MDELKNVAIPTIVGENDKISSTKDFVQAKRAASFVQYTTLDGKYYRPATKTVDKMPSALYRLMIDNAGIVFSREDIVTDNLLKFPDSKSAMILSEIDKFWSLKPKFEQYGFVHKRGFLLWGPPGGGKSCTVSLVAQEMINKQDGLVFLSQNPQTLEEAMRVIRQVEPNRKILVLLEDVDDILMHGNEHHLLNLLDGSVQADNVVYIATTNYPEKLPPRLVNRPSRFDKIVEIGYPSEEARQFYIEHKLGEGNHIHKETNQQTGEVEHINLATVTKGFTFAHLRDMIVSIFCLGMPTQETINRLGKMKYSPKSDDSGRGRMGIGSNDYSSDENKRG